MEIDWLTVRNTRSVEERSQAILEMISACTPGDPVFLSDCIVKAGNEGAHVLMELEALETKALVSRTAPMTWKILCLKDEWGKPPKPGSKIVKVAPTGFKRRDGKMVGSEERNVAILDGSYAEKFEIRTEYIVDEKGCIECSFTDAGYFLRRWGVHPKSNRTMITYPETSREPVDYPNGEPGEKRHCHYWRYKEMSKDAYEKLPTRVAEQRTENSHGRK